MSDLAWANEIGQASEDGDPLSQWNAAVDSTAVQQFSGSTAYSMTKALNPPRDRPVKRGRSLHLEPQLVVSRTFKCSRAPLKSRQLIQRCPR